MKFVFFSAALETPTLLDESSSSGSEGEGMYSDDDYSDDSASEEGEALEPAKDGSSSGDGDDIPEIVDDSADEADNNENTTTAAAESSAQPRPLPTLNSHEILTRDALLGLLQTKFKHLAGQEGAIHNDEHLVVGMVGYPNVGKSSTINALMRDKLVSVAATPGKTKHFQTLELHDRVPFGEAEEDVSLILCDCPGLVFPTQVSSRAEMICNGLLSIDHMRDFRLPMELLAKWIPRRLLEDVYSIHLPVEGFDAVQCYDLESGYYFTDVLPAATGSDLLVAYAAMRGFRTLHGSPDESRAARHLLKELVSGKLIYVHAPPSNGGPFTLNHTSVDEEKRARNEKWRATRAATPRDALTLDTPTTAEEAALRQNRESEAVAMMNSKLRVTNPLKSPLDRALHRKTQRMIKKGELTQSGAGAPGQKSGWGKRVHKGRTGKRRADANAPNFFAKQAAGSAHVAGKNPAPMQIASDML